MVVSIIVRILGLAALIWCPLTSISGASLEGWRWRNPLPTGNGLIGVAFLDGGFVAVGDGMQVLTSIDGVDWTLRTVAGEGVLYQVAFGNGLYVAVGDVGKGPAWGQIFTSLDLVGWTPQDPGATNRLMSVAFGNSLFVAVGDSGTLLTSSDGNAWTVQPSGWTAHLTHVAFGNGVFVAMAAGASNRVLVSNDGSHWEPEPVNESRQECLGFAAGRFYAANGFTLSSSEDGRGWSAVSTLPSSLVVAFGEGAGLVLAVTSGPLLASTDGARFTSVPTTGYRSGVHVVAFGNGRFVAAGGPQPLQASVDAIHWTAIEDSPKALLTDLAWGNGTYVAIGGGFPSATFPLNRGEPAVLLTASAEGPFRQQPLSTASPLSRVRFIDGAFYVVGADGLLLRSADGVKWAQRGSGAFEHLRGLADHDGMIVAVGDLGVVTTSSNGHAWTRRFSATGYSLNGVAHGGGQFVAVGFLGAVVTSPDGLVWTGQFADTRRTFFDICRGNDRFVAVGAAGIVFTSTDGVEWTAGESGTVLDLVRVAFGDGVFVAVGANGMVISSTDGSRWTPRHPGAYWDLYGVVFLNDSFLLLGEEGTILQSAASSVLRLVGEWNWAEGLFELQILGASGVSVQVQSSDDFSFGWIDREWFENVTGPVRYLDPTSSSQTQRFYRAVIR